MATPSMRLLRTLALGAALSTVACAPKIYSLDGASGPSGEPHTLVMVQGDRLDGASVIWDGTQIPGGFTGATMFSVPPDATPGRHNVTARNSHGDSQTFQLNVNPPAVPFPHPR